MKTIRLHVAPLGRGYIAESQSPEITALGASAMEAAENGRQMALELLAAAGEASPSSLVIRLDERHKSAIIVQPIHHPFSTRRKAPSTDFFYIDSDGNTA